MGTVLAIDVGGTKVAAGLVDDRGALLARAQRPTPRGEGAEAVFAAVLAVVAEVRRGDEQACGVGCGGPMAPGGTAVSPLNIADWRGFPLRQRLAEALDLPVHVDNDAKALALGEGWVGAAAGARDYIAMVVSTGVGGGIVLEGRLLHGAAGNAGHIGHVVVEPDGRPCACGARGCLEAEASGLAIEAITGRPPTEPTYEIMRRTGRLVGRAAGMICTAMDLDLVVVGGSVALGFGATFFNVAQEEIDAVARVGQGAAARITPVRLGDRGPLIGAGAVGIRGIRRRARAAA